ncbi:MAG: DUF2079 domain-containing protein [Candidatus Bathyarchaeia archaeon]
MRKFFGYKIYVLIAILIYTICFSIAEIITYYSFQIYTWDLGIFNQALWNTLHGRFLYYTTEPFYTRTRCFLGTHFSPIILLVLPIYAIYPKPEGLLVISTFIVAIGALPAYDLANFFLKKEKTAAILGIFYLLYPPLQGVTISGFSPEPFAVTIFLFVVLYLVKSDFRKLALAVAFGLLTHEASSVVIAFIALYGMLYNKSIKSKGFLASLIILIISIAYFFAAQKLRIFFGWTGIPSLWNEWGLIGAAGPTELPLKMITNPIGAWRALTYDGLTKISYLSIVFLPTLFLPFLGVQGLIPAIPYLCISLLSSYPLYYSVEGHYGAFMVPFIFLALIHGIYRLQKNNRYQTFVLKIVKITFLICVISLATFLPLMYSKFEIFQVFHEHGTVVYKFISSIPQNASVLTQSNLFPHLSNRPNAYTIPPPSWGEQYRQVGKEMLLNLSESGVDYVLLDFNSSLHYATAAEFIKSDFIDPNSAKYELLDEEDGVMLYKRINS